MIIVYDDGGTTYVAQCYDEDAPVDDSLNSIKPKNINRVYDLMDCLAAAICDQVENDRELRDSIEVVAKPFGRFVHAVFSPLRLRSVSFIDKYNTLHQFTVFYGKEDQIPNSKSGTNWINRRTSVWRQQNQLW